MYLRHAIGSTVTFRNSFNGYMQVVAHLAFNRVIVEDCATGYKHVANESELVSL